MDESFLFLSVLFGAVGMGYIVYGKKQERGVAFLSGVLLCALPYFGIDIWALLIVGALLSLAPFIFRV